MFEKIKSFFAGIFGDKKEPSENREEKKEQSSQSLEDKEHSSDDLDAHSDSEQEDE